MFHILQIVTVLVVSVVLAMSLAHVLEYPGNLRLDRDAYFAAQTIYYPGFSIAGICEPLSIAIVLALLVATSLATTNFWLVLFALLALIAMHVLFWLITQPVNKYWLVRERIGKTGARFFAVETARAAPCRSGRHCATAGSARIWRAALCVIAFIVLIVDLTL